MSSDRQTYVIFVNADVPKGSLKDIETALHAFNFLCAYKEFDATPFDDVRVRRLDKKMTGSRSWWHPERQGEWRASKGADVVFATNTGNRNFTASFLHRAVAEWIAEEDLGDRRTILRALGTQKPDPDVARMDAHMAISVQCLKEVLGMMLEAKNDTRGRWRDDAREAAQSETDKKDGSTSSRRDVSREQREGIRPKGEHSRPASFSGR